MICRPNRLCSEHLYEPVQQSPAAVAAKKKALNEIPEKAADKKAKAAEATLQAKAEDTAPSPTENMAGRTK